MRGWHRGLARHHLAQQARRARGGCQCGRRRGGRRQARHLARGALVQQRRDGFQMRIGHAPALGHAIEQHIGQRHDAHALVVGHEGVDRRERAALGLARRCEVERLDEAVAPARRELLQSMQILRGLVRGDLRGQHRGVGRDHEFVCRRAAQRQAWHALRRVLVGQGVVAAGVGRLADAPGHLVRRGEGDLLVQRRVAGFAQHAAVRLVQHQRGHQVFEHRARPRAQPGGGPDRIERPAQ